MTHSRIRTLLAAGALSALAAGAGVAGAASADKDKPRPAAEFQSQLADELGVSDAKLRAASERAAKDTVAALRRSGAVDAAKAERLTKRAQAGRALPFTRLGKASRRGGVRRAGVGALATALATERRALAAELRRGKVPAELIEAAGQDRAKVAQAVREAVRRQLDRRVQAGRLPAERADARAEKAAARLTGEAPLKRRGRAARDDG